MEAVVANTQITERQKFWRDHVLAAAASGGTIVEYAKSNNLKTKDIYQWKTSLTRTVKRLKANPIFWCNVEGYRRHR